MKRQIWLAVAVAAFALPALAQTSCLEAGNDEAAWTACGKARIEAAEARMQEAWRTLEGVSETVTLRDLAAEQDVWLKFKAAACTLYRDPEQFGPEIVAVGYPACIVSLIDERTEHLKAYRREIDP